VAGEPLFALLTADHVFGDGAIDRLLATGAPAVLVDPTPDRDAWLEGTRCGSCTPPGNLLQHQAVRPAREGGRA